MDELAELLRAPRDSLERNGLARQVHRYDFGERAAVERRVTGERSYAITPSE